MVDSGEMVMRGAAQIRCRQITDVGETTRHVVITVMAAAAADDWAERRTEWTARLGGMLGTECVVGLLGIGYGGILVSVI